MRLKEAPFNVIRTYYFDGSTIEIVWIDEHGKPLRVDRVKSTGEICAVDLTELYEEAP